MGNASFDGTYRPSNLTVSWMPDEDVYQKVNGNKFLFPLRSSNDDEWGIGPVTSLVTGQANFKGTF